MEPEHTVQYDSAGHTVQYDSVGHTVQYDSVGHTVPYGSNGYTVQYSSLETSHFGTGTRKFNNANTKNLQRVTDPVPSTSNPHSRYSTLILSCHFLLGLPSRRFPRGLQETYVFHPHAQPINNSSISLS